MVWRRLREAGLTYQKQTGRPQTHPRGAGAGRGCTSVRVAGLASQLLDGLGHLFRRRPPAEQEEGRLLCFVVVVAFRRLRLR